MPNSERCPEFEMIELIIKLDIISNDKKNTTIKYNYLKNLRGSILFSSAGRAEENANNESKIKPFMLKNNFQYLLCYSIFTILKT